VTFTVRFRRPMVASITLAVFAIVAAPLPALAGDPKTTATNTGPSIRTSVEKAVASHTLAASKSAVRAQETTTELGSKSFFRTPAGIVTLVALAAGVGYTVYSTSHDRVKSPAR
jgi:hypothetical protein